MHSLCKSVHNWWIYHKCAGIYAARKPTWIQTKNTKQKLSKKGLEEERKQYSVQRYTPISRILNPTYEVFTIIFIKKYKIFTSTWSLKLVN